MAWFLCLLIPGYADTGHKKPSIVEMSLAYDQFSTLIMLTHLHDLDILGLIITGQETSVPVDTLNNYLNNHLMENIPVLDIREVKTKINKSYDDTSLFIDQIRKKIGNREIIYISLNPNISCCHRLIQKVGIDIKLREIMIGGNEPARMKRDELLLLYELTDNVGLIRIFNFELALNPVKDEEMMNRVGCYQYWYDQIVKATGNDVLKISKSGLIPLYVHDTSIFSFQVYPAREIYVIKGVPDNCQIQYQTMLEESFSIERRPVVTFRKFPDNPEFYLADLGPLVHKIREKYGEEEWNAAVIASEMHGHLGVYSLIGVKMGIRAREILHAGMDELEVESFAGSEPPVSCLTDGLQVSTGASLGRGSVRVNSSVKQIPSARFKKGSTVLILTLKKEIVAAIRTDIQKAIDQYGLNTVRYFEEIRKYSLDYWNQLDRKDIFMISIEK